MKTIDFRTFWMAEFKSLFGALFVAVIATCCLFLSSAIIGLIIPVGTKISELIAYLTYDLVVAAGCYFLCMQNPNSIWFVPVLSNTTGIVSVFVEPNFWITPMWILLLLGWMISFVTSVWGHDIGIRNRRSQR